MNQCRRLWCRSQPAAEHTAEITAIPQLLDRYGRTVTIDAIGTWTAIAARMIQRSGQYGLTLKEHQPTLEADVNALCADARAARQPTSGIQTRVQ